MKKRAEKCTEKLGARAKLFFANKTYSFLTFSLPSMSLDLKVPVVKVKQSSIVSQIVSSPDVLSWLVLLDPVNKSFVRCR